MGSNSVHNEDMPSKPMQCAGFVKLYGFQLYNSSLWMESLECRFMFIALLAAADRDGFVDCPSMRALAHRTNLTVEQAAAGIGPLLEPDKNSRSKAHEGRRVLFVEGDGYRGYQIVNYEKYREYRSHRQEYKAAWMRQHRGEKKESPESVHTVSSVSTSGPRAQPDARMHSVSLFSDSGVGETVKPLQNTVPSPNTELSQTNAGDLTEKSPSKPLDIEPRPKLDDDLLTGPEIADIAAHSSGPPGARKMTFRAKDLADLVPRAIRRAELLDILSWFSDACEFGGPLANIRCLDRTHWSGAFFAGYFDAIAAGMLASEVPGSRSRMSW